jgi:hypothetical protein
MKFELSSCEMVKSQQKNEAIAVTTIPEYCLSEYLPMEYTGQLKSFNRKN